MNNSECHIFHVNLNLFFPETILCKPPIPVPPHLHFPSETYVPILVISSMLYVIFQNLFLCVWVMYHFDEPFSQPSILLFFPLLGRCFRNLTPRIEYTWLIYKGTLSFIFSLCLVHRQPPDQYMLAPSDHLLNPWLMSECTICKAIELKNLRRKWLPHMNILIPYFAYVNIKDELFHLFISYFPSA